MALEKLEFGDSLAGLLIDGVDETPFVVATLTYSEDRGVRIEVPYLHHSETGQFKVAENWFDSGATPKNLAFVTRGGTLSLFGCRYSGHSMNFGHGYAMGYITPDEVVMHGRDGNFSDDLTVSEFASELDGLPEWTRFRSVTHERETGDDGRLRRVTVTAKNVEEFSWDQNDATMYLKAVWSSSPSSVSSPEFRITEWVSLGSRFTSPRPLSEHLTEHRKVASLIKLNFGQAIYFRRHKIRDSRFPDKLLSGEHVGNSFREAICRQTFRDSLQPKPSAKKLRRPIFHLAQVSEEGVRGWSESYTTWKRFIEPSVSVLSRPRAALEDIVVNASMSLEAAGILLGHASGEEETHSRSGKPTTATYTFRGIASLGLDWRGIAETPVGLARAIANNYNTIKHYDRGEFPDQRETYFVSQVAMMVVRLLAVNLVDPSGQLVQQYGASSPFDDLRETCRLNSLFVDRLGKFVDYPT
ncbi:ApeA N-terminal domain 1-containing protein [Streptomyces sp. NPDC054796]